MKKDLTLVILAAGMGSRFGGLKQIEPIGPNGEFIIDYSIYDALKAGFTKVVFLIKEEMYDVFRDTIGRRIESKINVEYAFQKITAVPKGILIPKERKKPWGTAHAVLSCKKNVEGNFLIINADDFYGRDSYMKIANYFNNLDNNDYAMVAFKVENTITENGSVKRGLCEIKKDLLNNIAEYSIEKVDSNIIATPIDGSKSFEIESNSLVSMNFFGFTTNIFTKLENDFHTFFEKNKDNLINCEYMLPDVIFEEINDGKKVHVLKSQDKWLGITYKNDKEYVKEEIRKLIHKGIYPNNLWK